MKAYAEDRVGPPSKELTDAQKQDERQRKVDEDWDEYADIDKGSWT